MLEARRQPYVLAVRSNQTLRMIAEDGFVQTDPKTIAETLAAEAWETLAAGEGSEGFRLYDWARYALPWTVEEGFERWLLIRRNRKEPNEYAFISCSHNMEPALLNSRARPVCAGPSRNVSNAARAISLSTIARRAPGMAGIDT